MVNCDDLCQSTVITKRDESTLRLVSFVKPLCVRCGKKRARDEIIPMYRIMDKKLLVFDLRQLKQLVRNRYFCPQPGVVAHQFDVGSQAYSTGCLLDKSQ